MNLFDYSRIRATADKLIARFGQAATLSSTDPATGAVTTRVAKAVNMGPVKHTLGDSGVSIGDDRLLLDHAAAPKPGDRVAYGAESRVIVDPVSPIQPGDTVLGFEIYARAG